LERPLSMLSPEKSLRESLGPSPFSADGFLGSDVRTPEDIIEEDRKEMLRYGVTKEKIALALRDLYVKAERALGNPVKISDTITLRHEEARGQIPSPFPGDGAFQKGHVKVSDAPTGQSFLITPLSIHLIEKHGFFQGKGSKYRIEPEIAARFVKELPGKK
jgi:hypothetical protein